MIVKVLAHARRVMADGDAERGQIVPRSDTRAHQDRGRPDGARAKDNAPGHANLRSVDQGRADRPFALPEQPIDLRTGAHLDAVLPPQEATRGRHAAAACHVVTEKPRAFAVRVGKRVVEHGCEPMRERMGMAQPCRAQRLFDSREGGRNIPCPPSRHVPVIEIRVPPPEPDHGVDRPRSPHHPPARHTDLASARGLLRDGPVAPVARPAEQPHQTEGHRDEWVCLGRPGLENQYRPRAPPREFGGHNATRRSRSDDEEIPHQTSASPLRRMVQPFTAPAVSPLTIWRWKNRTSTNSGAVADTTAATANMTLPSS
jgi:hypothetical protein